MNAAGVLLSFFGSRSSKIRFNDLVEAYATVARYLSEAKEDGNHKAAIVVDCLPKLWFCVSRTFDSDSEYVGPYMGSDFSDECRLSLVIAEEMLEEKASTYPAERREKVKQLLESLPVELDALSLPQELRLYVLRLAREVRVAIDEYEITGDFKLDAAFSRLQTQLFVVATHLPVETQQSRFVKFLTDKFIPCMTALSLTLTSTSDGLNLENMIVQQIQSGAPQTSVSAPPSETFQADSWTEPNDPWTEPEDPWTEPNNPQPDSGEIMF